MKIHKCLRIFILFCKISLIFAQYIPTPRYRHASTLIDSKLYFIGGIDDNNSLRADFFYLDLSNPFTTKSPLPFASINNNGLTPNAMCTTATIKNIIYLIGGNMTDDSSLVYRYDIYSNQWTKPPIAGTSPVRRFRNGLIVNPSTNQIYYFGGIERIVFNDMWILNANNSQLSWQQITPNGGVLPSSYGFTATLLTDGNILYIGGKFEKDYIPMNNITRYNIKSNSWDTVKTQGHEPVVRGGHSAVLVPADGRIIVYGGRMVVDGDEHASFPTSEDLVVLDTTKHLYEWVFPKQVENKPAVTRSFHTACLYKNYMIVAFGNLTDKTGPTSEILILNVADKLNYKWVTNITEPKQPPPTTTSKTDSPEISEKNDNNIGIIIGSTIGGISGLALISAVICVIYYRFRNRSRPNDYAADELLEENA